MQNYKNRLIKSHKQDKDDKIKRYFFSNIWRASKDYLPSKFSCLTRIKFDDAITSSPQVIANKLNEYYVKKIDHMMQNIAKDSSKALKILQSLVPPSKKTFNFTEVSHMDVNETIQRMPAKRTVGSDDISGDMLKQIPEATTIRIPRIFNKMIETCVFPDVLKTARILPILNQEENPLDPASY